MIGFLPTFTQFIQYHNKSKKVLGQKPSDFRNIKNTIFLKYLNKKYNFFQNTFTIKIYDCDKKKQNLQHLFFDLHYHIMLYGSAFILESFSVCGFLEYSIDATIVATMIATMIATFYNPTETHPLFFPREEDKQKTACEGRFLKSELVCDH